MDSASTPTTGDEKANTSEEESKGTSLTAVLGSIAQISGVVTVVAGTIYALGMITLLLPIYNAYDTTFSAAWYMVSLIPKTTVAGYGAKSLLWPSLATVLPIAFITVMILTVFSLLWVAVRHAARHARDAQGDLIRGLLFIVAVYAGYSVLLGAVTVTMPFLLNLLFGSVDSEGAYAILRYHVVAQLLAYSILAVLSALTLLLLALRAATFIANLATAKAFSYASFLTLGSLRASLYLALCVGMACVVASGLKLLSLGFFGAELFDPQAELAPKPLIAVWGDALSTLIVLLPMVLLLLLVDRAIPLKLLDPCGPRLRAAGYTCRIFSIVTVIGTALLGIFYFFFAFDVYGQFVRSRATLILETDLTWLFL